MKIENVTSFMDLVEKLNKHRYAIVNISASWCKPCKVIKPQIEKFVSVVDDYNGKYVYLRIDHSVYETDDNFDKIFKMTKLPYFGIIKDTLLVLSMVSGDFIEVSTLIHKYIQSEETASKTGKAKNLDLTNDF